MQIRENQVQQTQQLQRIVGNFQYSIPHLQGTTSAQVIMQTESCQTESRYSPTQHTYRQEASGSGPLISRLRKTTVKTTGEWWTVFNHNVLKHSSSCYYGEGE